MSVEGIDHVQLAAPPGCEEAARWFFGELLGLTEVDKPAPLRARGGVWFQAGSQQLHIGVEDPLTPATKAHPALRARPDALEPLAARLEAAGIEVVWDDALEGVRRFYAADPWGNRIELAGCGVRQAVWVIWSRMRTKSPTPPGRLAAADKKLALPDAHR